MLFDGSTTHEEFCSLGESFLSYFLINHARIGPNDRILDIGCGLGQKDSRDIIAREYFRRRFSGLP